MVFVTAKVHFIPVAFALTCVSSVALATTAPTKKSGTDKISHPAPRTASGVGNAHPKAVNGRQEDLFVVSSRAPNGVSNTTPGGGLLPIQTAPRLQSGVTRDFIAKQAQTSNALSLLQMSPGAVVGSADPLGLSDHAGISVRGMDVSELGLVFEGMPAGDPIYGIADTAEWQIRKISPVLI
ncbi:Plug domain-containing protein [Acetobacter papayae]|uniref:Plug domain-containing protein n=1 Tax=Acetobacter papayae TaxID=1076592 RepID=UPI001F48B198|nr:Plug domain-containing protein [Acetobacter papayae]